MLRRLATSHDDDPGVTEANRDGARRAHRHRATRRARHRHGDECRGAAAETRGRCRDCQADPQRAGADALDTPKISKGPRQLGDTQKPGTVERGDDDAVTEAGQQDEAEDGQGALCRRVRSAEEPDRQQHEGECDTDGNQAGRRSRVGDDEQS